MREGDRCLSVLATVQMEALLSRVRELLADLGVALLGLPLTLSRRGCLHRAGCDLFKAASV